MLRVTQFFLCLILDDAARTSWLVPKGKSIVAVYV